MKDYQLVFLLVFCWTGGLQACGPNFFLYPPLTAPGDPVHTASISSGAVNLELLKILIRESGDRENIMISPVGISASMAMVSLASVRHTKAEIDRIFQFDILNKYEPNLVNLIFKRVSELDFRNTFDTARSFFGDVSLLVRQDFQYQLLHWFREPLRQLAFKSGLAEGRINSWVAGLTEGKILDTIPAGALRPELLIVVNAIASKAIWRYGFNTSQTKLEPFHLNSYQQEDVEMMDNYNTAYPDYLYYHDEQLRFQLLEIPYSTDYLSMLILLPDEVGSLRSIVDRLNVPKLIELYFKMKEESVHVKLPKFQLETENYFKDTLIKLGVRDVFSPSANIWGVCSPYEPIKLAQVKLKAFLQVNEQGVRGKAASALPPPAYSQKPYQREFVVNHPFLFIVFDAVTGFVALTGAIYNP